MALPSLSATGPPPLDVREAATEMRGDVRVVDLSYASPRGGRVPAWLVLPAGSERHPAALFVHPGQGDRSTFLDEAVELARRGVAGLLVGAPSTRAEYQDSPRFFDGQAERAEWTQLIVDVRRGLDLLAARAEIDPQRLAYVGHSLGATAGGVLAGVEHRPRAWVLMAGLPSYSQRHEFSHPRTLAALDRLVTPDEQRAYAEALEPIDAVHYLRDARGAFLLQFARRDEFIAPRDAALYTRATPEPKTVLWYDTDHFFNAQARRDRDAWLLRALVASSTTPEELAQAPSRFAALGGLRVHYKSFGDGPQALVLVHGWTCDMSFWRLQVPELSRRGRLIVIDLPGHGASDKPEVRYTMDLFARAVDAVLDDAGIEKAVLVGHSMGAVVVRQCYRRHPERVAALVTVDGALRSMLTDPKQIDAFVARFEAPDYRERMAEFVRAMFPKEAPAELVSGVEATMSATPQHVAVSAMRGMLDPAIWSADPIGVPVGAVMADSPAWSDFEAFLRTLSPRVEYRVVPGASHFLMLEKPSEFEAALNSVLDAVGPN
jgi:pimeloyl-ACP methyl ester carboxylesterase